MKHDDTLVLIATTMEFERCYLDEWLAFHFQLGVTAIYLLPQWGGLVRSSARIKDLVVADPRVSVLCKHQKSGQPTECISNMSQPYSTRAEQSQLMVSWLAPQMSGGWLLLLDIDEFLTVPDPTATLRGVLRKFSLLQARLVRVNYVTFGANNVKTNPSCGTINVFRIPARAECAFNHVFKSLFLARRGLKVAKSGLKLAHQQIFEPTHAFAADGYHLGRCDGMGCTGQRIANCSSKSRAACSFWGWAPPRPWLQLRHYMTRSQAEWDAKIKMYQPLRKILGTQYSLQQTSKRFKELNEQCNRWAPCSMDKDTECVPLRGWHSAWATSPRKDTPQRGGGSYVTGVK